MRVRSLIAAAACLAVGGAAPVPARAEAPQEEPCYERTFHKVAIQEAANPNVVRIIAVGALGTASGTGFVVASQREDELEIVTSSHVVHNADRISALLSTRTGKTVEITGIEVCRDSHQFDLALLCSPRLPGGPRGLHLSTSGVHLGQDVATIGYPGVRGSPMVASFESGEVSASVRVVDGRTYIQTNININPGASGGPVLDACGEVVGVVAAVSTQAQRIGLIVPVADVQELITAYLAPRPPTDVGVRTRLSALAQAVRSGNAEDQAELFSREFLVKVVVPQFRQFLAQSKAVEAAAARLARQNGIDYDDLTLEQRNAILVEFVDRGLMSRDQYVAWFLSNGIAGGQLGVYEGLQRYLALSSALPDFFGALRTLKVLDVTEVSSTSAMARVQIVNTRNTRIYNFRMALEANEWHIADITCVNCRE